MLTEKDRIVLTIQEIEYSDEYDEHQTLFDTGISVLNKLLESDEDLVDCLTEEDRLILEDVFAVINCE